MVSRREDLADRALAVLARTLPAHRKEWGRAMRAELAAIDEIPARRQFVRGCARAVLISGTALRAVAGYVGMLAFAAVIAYQAAGLESAGVQVEAAVLVGIIAVLAWFGRRSSIVGPPGIDLVPRLMRLAGYAVVMTTEAALLTTGTNDPTGWWVAAVAISLYLVGFLRATSLPAGDALSLPVTATLTLTGLAVWWIPMLLSSGVRAFPGLTFLVAFALVLVGWAWGSRRGTPMKGLVSGFAATTATLLLMFLAALFTYRLAPGLVPDISGPGYAGGLTPQAKAETNRIESVDPYVADLLFGALLSGVLTWASVPATRPESTVDSSPLGG